MVSKPTKTVRKNSKPIICIETPSLTVEEAGLNAQNRASSLLKEVYSSVINSPVKPLTAIKVVKGQK